MERELIHADEHFNDINSIRRIKTYDAVADLRAVSDYVLQMPAEEWLAYPVEIGHIIYMPDTEWGGYVTRVKTMGDTVEVGGALWRGLLRKNVISPPAGQAYRVVSGAAKTAITSLLGQHFGSLFSVVDGDAVSVSSQFRYQEIGAGIERMLADAGARLDITQRDPAVELSARRITDWSQTYEFSEDYGVLLTIERDITQDINHVVGLGSGELTERLVLEAWLLPDGTITYDGSAPGRPTGMDERTYKLDYPNAESEEELRDSIAEALLESRRVYKTQMDLTGAQIVDLQLGDIVASRDRLTGTYAKQTITKKIYRIAENGISTLRYEVAGG